MEKVLLVDDDEGVLTLLSSALEHAGYYVIAQESATQALKIIESEKIPVVVSDIMMPEMSGLTLLERIKERSPETVVIFITANASLDSAIFAIKEGAFAYLRKPFNPNELIIAVRNAYVKVRLLENNTKLVNELKMAKEYSETILKTLTYTVIAMDPQGKIKKLNHAMEKLLGYKESELLSQPIEIIFSQEFLATGWQKLVNEHEVKDLPVDFKRKDGSVVHQFFTGTIMKDDAGKIVGFFGNI